MASSDSGPNQLVFIFNVALNRWLPGNNIYNHAVLKAKLQKKKTSHWLTEPRRGSAIKPRKLLYLESSFSAVSLRRWGVIKGSDIHFIEASFTSFAGTNFSENMCLHTCCLKMSFYQLYQWDPSPAARFWCPMRQASKLKLSVSVGGCKQGAK